MRQRTYKDVTEFIFCWVLQLGMGPTLKSSSFRGQSFIELLPKGSQLLWKQIRNFNNSGYQEVSAGPRILWVRTGRLAFVIPSWGLSCHVRGFCDSALFWKRLYNFMLHIFHIHIYIQGCAKHASWEPTQMVEYILRVVLHNHCLTLCYLLTLN